MFTNNRGCDLIKKKTGIIKPEGEIVKERLFITPEYTTAKEIKKIRKAEILKDLGLPFYDPIMIIEKTEGRMAEDDFWIRIER